MLFGLRLSLTLLQQESFRKDNKKNEKTEEVEKTNEEA